MQATICYACKNVLGDKDKKLDFGLHLGPASKGEGKKVSLVSVEDEICEGCGDRFLSLCEELGIPVNRRGSKKGVTRSPRKDKGVKRGPRKEKGTTAQPQAAEGEKKKRKPRKPKDGAPTVPAHNLPATYGRP